MQPSRIIVSGHFFGGELEPGTFHDRHLSPGLCVPGEGDTPLYSPRLTSASADRAANTGISEGTFSGAKIEDGVFHSTLVGVWADPEVCHVEALDLTESVPNAGGEGLDPPLIPPDQNVPLLVH